MSKYIAFTSTRIKKYTGALISFSKVGEVQLIENEEIYNYLLTEQPSMFKEVSEQDAIQEKESVSEVTPPVEPVKIAPPQLEDDLDIIKAEVIESDDSVPIEVIEDPVSAVEVEFCNVLSSHDEALTLKEIADVMGVSTQKLISVSKRLIDKKNVKKVGNEYQLI